MREHLFYRLENYPIISDSDNRIKKQEENRKKMFEQFKRDSEKYSKRKK